MLEYLKVKVMSISDEQKIIRREEQLAKYKARANRARIQEGKAAEDPARYTEVNRGLHAHRVIDCRKELRSSHLAYGFVKGLKYRQMEPLAYAQPNWDRIERLIEKYGEGDTRTIKQQFAAWKAEALAGIKPNYQKTIAPGSQKGQWTEWMHRGRELQKHILELTPA